MRRGVFAIVLTCVAAFSARAESRIELDSIAVYDPQMDLAKVLECDREAAHSEDPHRVAQGVWRAVANVEEAVLACEVAVEDHPDSARSLYQLSRAYDFAGRSEEASALLWRSVRTGYPQALFSAGFFSIEGGSGVDIDPCRGAALLHRAAKTGHYGGLIAYVHFRLTGAAPADCAGLPLDPDELAGFVEQARQIPADFFRTALVEQLGLAVAALPRESTGDGQTEAAPTAPASEAPPPIGH